MWRILRSWRVAVATLFSAVLVIGVYMLASGVESPQAVQASTETALLQAIATKDSSGDGLPDWEKTLYGIPVNSTTTDYFHLGMTDGEAVAKGLIVPKAIADIPIASSTTSYTQDGLPPPPAEGTLTAAFSKNFLTLYLSAKQAAGGTGLSKNQMGNIANETIKSITSLVSSAPDYKSEKDLNVSGSGADALKIFAANAEDVFAKNNPGTSKSEISYLRDALEKNDSTAYTHISLISKSYRDSAVGIAALSVPAELVQADLALINAMMRVSEISSDFTRVNDDPLAAILALQQYPEAMQSIGTDFTDIGKIYATAGISLSKGEPGFFFVNLMKNVANRYHAAKRP